MQSCELVCRGPGRVCLALSNARGIGKAISAKKGVSSILTLMTVYPTPDIEGLAFSGLMADMQAYERGARSNSILRSYKRALHAKNSIHQSSPCSFTAQHGTVVDGCGTNALGTKWSE